MRRDCNLSDADVGITIEHLPELCAAEESTIWARGTFGPDLTPTLRQWFTSSEVVESSSTAVAGTTMSMSRHRLAVTPKVFRPDWRLFTFLPK